MLLKLQNNKHQKPQKSKLNKTETERQTDRRTVRQTDRQRRRNLHYTLKDNPTATTTIIVIVIIIIIIIILISGPMGSFSRGEDVTQLSLPTPFYSVLVSVSVFMNLSTIPSIP